MISARHLLSLALLTTTASAADTTVNVINQNGFSATAVVSDCSSGCSKQMTVTSRYQFIFAGDYDALYAEIAAVGLRMTVYDAEWADAESGELLFKVSSTIHQRQRWRRANLRRKIDTPTELANAIYSTVPAGTEVTLEFLQVPTPLTSTDFTINARRYVGDALVSTASRAILIDSSADRVDTR